MVCKKYQVYDWFRTLDGAKRIDFLNGMLHLCFPLELRFLGSCIEELARKDYSYLRDAEIKANAANEIQLMRDISDKVTRSKMIVTLALLASGNYECARYLFDLLNIDIMDLLDKMKSCLDEKIADEFLLLLTMAANHPAFDFQMKTKMSQLYLNAEYKLKQNKILLKESESDLNLFNKSGCEQMETLEQATTGRLLNNSIKNMNGTVAANSVQEGKKDKSLAEINNSELLLLKNTLNDIKNNINNSCRTQQNQNPSQQTQEINNNSLNKKKNRNKVDDVENLANSFEGLLDVNSMMMAKDQVNEGYECELLPEEEKLNDSLIESINFEGVQTIKGTENYKFIIKIQWSDKTFNEIDKTYSELCEFNKQLINLYPKELSGLMESSKLVLKENQKEDFIKELPLVTDYCSKIASLPKVVCESDFLRSFFRSNLSSSSITIANDSNSPNRQVIVKNPPSNQSSAEKKPKSTVTKKLIPENASNTTTADTTKNSVDTETNAKKSSGTEQPTLKASNEVSNEAPSSETVVAAAAAATAPVEELVKSEVETSKKMSGSLNTNLVRTKTNAATVSVANIMNTDLNSSKTSKNKAHERLNSNESNIRNNSLPPTAPGNGTNHHLIHAQMMPPQQQQPNPIYSFQHPQPPPQSMYQPHQLQLLNNQYQPVPSTGNSISQPLHLHTFQPINNMIIGSPPCASPTTAATNATNTNPHSLNNSRSNSPWMMMPPPLPPLQPSLPGPPPPNIHSTQQFYQHPHHNHNRSSSINKNNSSSNLGKDSGNSGKQSHYNNYYSPQDELLLRYALDNSNNNSHHGSSQNMQHANNAMNPSSDDNAGNGYERANRKVSESNSLNRKNSKTKSIGTAESLLTTALNNNNNNQYNTDNSTNNQTTENNNGVSSGSNSSGAMSPKPTNETSNNTNNANNNTNNTNTSTATTNNANSNLRSSSSSYHQTPPPQQTSMPPPNLVPAQHNQPPLTSPNQHATAHAAAIAAYNATLQQIAVAYQTHQKSDQYSHHQQQLPPNHHLIPINYQQHPPPPLSSTNQQQQQPGNGPAQQPQLIHGPHPLVLAPLMGQVGHHKNPPYMPVNFPPGAFPPLPPHHPQQVLNKYPNGSSKNQQQFKHVPNPQDSRSQTPPVNNSGINLVTSDDENTTFDTISKMPGHRGHRKSIPGLSSFPLAHKFSRQHTSNSISVTNPSSGSSSSSSMMHSSSGMSLKNTQTCSTSTLVSSTNGTVVNSNNNSQSVSPGSESMTTTATTTIKQSDDNSPTKSDSQDLLKKTETTNNLPTSGSTSPKSKRSSSSRVSFAKDSESNATISVDSTSTEKTETSSQSTEVSKASAGKSETNSGPFSGSSTSSASSLTSNNTQALPKSPKLTAATNVPQQQSQSQQYAQNGNLFYSPVVSPFPFIDANNANGPVYVQNGTSAPQAVPTSQHPHQHHLGVPPHYSYQQPQYVQVHHQNPHYYNSVPIQQQQQSYQSSSTNSTNCATPTPGSSPNTVSAAAQQIGPNNQPNTYMPPPPVVGAGQQLPPQMVTSQPPPPQASGNNTNSNHQSMDQHHKHMNPYNLHHMMSLVNGNGNHVQHINPNMVMMMMMNPQGQMQPVPPGQLKAQPYSYPQFQPYHRPMTPNTLQQQQQNSPSMSSNLLHYAQHQQQQQQQQHNSRKKVSCYNCGSMSHTASECKEPTLESISQPTQFRLNFKVNNNQPGSGSMDELYKNDTNNLTATKQAKSSATGKNSISPNTNPTLLTATSSNFK